MMRVWSNRVRQLSTIPIVGLLIFLIFLHFAFGLSYLFAAPAWEAPAASSAAPAPPSPDPVSGWQPPPVEEHTQVVPPPGAVIDVFRPMLS